MLRALLKHLFCLALIVSPAVAAPVAVNDSYSTNEDTILSVSPTPFLSDAFPTSLGAWTYANNIFSSSNVNGTSSGAWTGSAGNPAGSLQMTRAYSVNTGTTRSGGFSAPFTLPAAQTVRVTFDYLVSTTGASAGATVQIHSRTATSGATNNLFTFTSGTTTSVWRTATYTSTLAAGAQTLQIGAIITNNSAFGPPTATINIDNVKVEPTVSSGVLTNDTGGATTAALVANVSHGTLAFNADGSFVYTPTANYNGPDSFTYTASDGATTSNVATVSLTVNAVNDAPIGAIDNYSTEMNTVLNVPAATGVLLNDTDVDSPAASLTATLVANPVNGTVVLNPNGSFTYTPNTGITGADNFTYTVSDGVATSASTTVNINVTQPQSPPVGVADSYTLVRNSSMTVSATTAGSSTTDAVPFLSTGWKYLDNGTDQGSAWRAPSFVDTSWKTGTAELGYGDTDEATVVEDNGTAGYVSADTDRYITTYFRKTFTVTDAHLINSVAVTLKYDDAGIVYINGTQVLITSGLTTGALYNGSPLFRVGKFKRAGEVGD